MRETHTISADSKLWEQVFDYAKENNSNISYVTQEAWKQYFEEKKEIRRIDYIILILIITVILIMMVGVWNI